MRMGIPKLLTTDQGSEFKNHVNDEMMQLLKIKHRLTTAYHPQVHIYIYILLYLDKHSLSYITTAHKNTLH